MDATPSSAAATVEAVELHLVALDVEGPRLAKLHSHLDAAERRRESKLGGPEARRRFVVARGQLRELLGARIGMAPGSVPLLVSEDGKPRLRAASALPDIGFNVSHSGERALIAISGGVEVGVDLERPRRLHRPERLAARILNARDLASWRSVPIAHREVELMRWWTRKEAYAKLVGSGLRTPLGEIELSRSGPREPWLVGGRDTPGGTVAIVDLDLESGWSGALAGAGLRLVHAGIRGITTPYPRRRLMFETETPEAPGIEMPPIETPDEGGGDEGGDEGGDGDEGGEPTVAGPGSE
jgi:4'-phosphopantetheinyl transferase